MSHERPAGVVSRLSAPSLGVFRGSNAVDLGVTRKQLGTLVRTGVIERAFPDVYRMTAVSPSNLQSLRAALLWAGHSALAAGLSAAEVYGLEGASAAKPEIMVPRARRLRSSAVVVHQSDDRAASMARRYRNFRVTGVEATLVALASVLDGEAFEIACEDARRRQLTSVDALRTYLARYAGAGRPGVAPLRDLLDQIDPEHPARSTLEVKTRRLLVAHGLTDFTREFPLTWEGRTYRFDFAFEHRRTILETNGRRWHDDVTDYEHDNEKWSVPGRLGYRIVFATWETVTRAPARLLADLGATLAA